MENKKTSNFLIKKNNKSIDIIVSIQYKGKNSLVSRISPLLPRYKEMMEKIKVNKKNQIYEEVVSSIIRTSFKDEDFSGFKYIINKASLLGFKNNDTVKIINNILEKGEVGDSIYSTYLKKNLNNVKIMVLDYVNEVENFVNSLFYLITIEIMLWIKEKNLEEILIKEGFDKFKIKEELLKIFEDEEKTKELFRRIFKNIIEKIIDEKNRRESN